MHQRRERAPVVPSFVLPQPQFNSPRRNLSHHLLHLLFLRRRHLKLLESALELSGLSVRVTLDQKVNNTKREIFGQLVRPLLDDEAVDELEGRLTKTLEVACLVLDLVSTAIVC